MASEFHKSASKNGVSITAYRGDGSALLAFDLDPQLATELFAGFAIEATAPDGRHKKGDAKFNERTLFIR